jgi:hypothetical protein
MDISEIFESASFWILAGIGYFAILFMLFILKKMGQSSIMPLWVKIITLLLVPIIAALFSLYAES